MSYDIIKSISIVAGKVMVRSACSNIVPKTYSPFHSQSLTDILNEKGRSELDKVVFEEFRNGNFQGMSTPYAKALAWKSQTGLECTDGKLLNKFKLFNNLTKITDKLTKGSRENMLNTLTARTDVDFNNDNIYAVVIWVIKNANVYYDNQLINLVERMVEKANVVLYKSNKRTFADEQWRYYRHPEGLEQYSLDYRIILERVGGLASTEWIGEYSRHNGLKESAYYFIMDILTVATNIGFDTSNRTTPSDFQWESNKGHDFYCYDYTKQKEVILMSVKAFKNGNLHVKFAPKFIMRLNVEFGRLKSWLKNYQHAADEMGIEITDAMESFNSNLKLSSDNFVKLGFMQAA